MRFDARFDALVGRYVLQFQPDPAAMLGRLLRHLRPGGTVVFHEIDWSEARSYPPVELWERCCDFVREAVENGGADPRAGSKLPRIFTAAGLPAPEVRMSSIVGAGGNSDVAVRRLAEVARTLWPAAGESQSGLLADLDPESLVERLQAATAANGSFVFASSEIGAWSSLGS
jgi:SAM-dependent methyltransferase